MGWRVEAALAAAFVCLSQPHVDGTLGVAQRKLKYANNRSTASSALPKVDVGILGVSARLVGSAQRTQPASKTGFLNIDNSERVLPPPRPHLRLLPHLLHLSIPSLRPPPRPLPRLTPDRVHRADSDERRCYFKKAIARPTRQDDLWIAFHVEPSLKAANVRRGCIYYEATRSDFRVAECE